MAIDYNCATAAPISLEEGKRLLMLEVALSQSKEDDAWVRNDGVVVMLNDYSKRPLDPVVAEFCGFSPKFSIMMRPRLTTTEQQVELGQRTMMRIVNFLLRQSTEDVYFSYELEHLILVRRAGNIRVSSKFDRYLGDAYLSELTFPYTTENLQP
jgi:hypothetical protein